MIERNDEAARKELLKSAYRKIEDLRARLASSEGRESEPVAIVGMACRFPAGVDDADSYWQLLSSGKDGVTEIPPDRWNIDDYYDPDPEAPGKMYVRRGGFIDNVRGFDPLLFHVSPQEASSMDPQQRLLLEVAWEALENAGQAPDRLAGTPTSVFVGLAGIDYSIMAVWPEHDDADQTHSATGSSHSIAAGRISYFFGFRGPCVAIDTACSSALTSIHLAAQSLRKGESTMALAGSVNLNITPKPNVIVCKARMLSADGKCKSFDASADGYVRSEGCGMLVLKLLSRAEADGDRILALIRGTACNQDGRTNGITAPSGNAQRDVIQAALAASHLSAHDIGYVETHGTGTSLGDPIEVQALGEVFATGRPSDSKLVLGAVKSNIGHMESAAGIAGVSKVILALQKEQIPPNLHFHNPNPLIAWDSLPFLVPTELIPWPAVSGRRLAGVSAFGFSGTNVHLILEQAPRRAPAAIESDRPCHVLTLSAQSPEPLSELAKRYSTYLSNNPTANLADLCFTANTGRAQFAHRLALTASSVDELKTKLEHFLEQPADASVRCGRAPSQPPPVGLFITEQSTSDVHRQLYKLSPVFKAAVDACDSAANELYGVSLQAALWNPSKPSPAPTGVSARNERAAAFALSYAMAAVWGDWGLVPAAVSGCGVGRYVAAVQAGAMSLPDGLRLAADPQAVKTQPIAWSTPKIPLLSSLTGLPLASDTWQAPEELSPEVGHCAVGHSAEWANLLTGFQREGIRLVLAIGAEPRRTNSETTNSETTNSETRPGADAALNCVSAPDAGWSGLLDVLGKLYVAGVSLDWRKIESPWPRQRLALPMYPFQRQECWLNFNSPSGARKALKGDVHPLLGRRLHSPQFRDEIVFEAEFDTNRLPLLKDHRFFSTVVVPATAMLEMGSAAGGLALRTSDVLLTDFLIEQPLLLPEGQTSLVQTVLTPNGEKAYSFVVMSTDVDKLEGVPVWKRHCSGKLTTATGSPAPAAEPGILNRLHVRYNQPADPQWFYDLTSEAGVEYGPSFRLIQEIGRDENGNLTLLRMPAELTRQSAAYRAHPGLLDSALQALAIAFHPDKSAGDSVYMPVAVESYRLLKPGTSEWWCHGELRPRTDDKSETFVGDVQFYSPAGEAIGELKGIYFKRTPKRNFTQELIERQVMNWLFEARWEPLAALPTVANAAGSWLIVADGSPIADEFAKLVRQRSGQAIVARAGTAFLQHDHDTYSLRFESASDYDQLLRMIGESSESLRKVVYFAAGLSEEGGRSHDVPQLARSATEQLLQLTQALARSAASDLPSLALITQGFQTPSIGIPASLSGSSAWGLGRVIASEMPDVHCKLIDLEKTLSASEAARLLLDELGCESDESQVSLAEGKRLALRLTQADMLLLNREHSLNTNPSNADPNNAVEMEITTRGDFRQLRFVPQRLQPPGAGEVQLRVLATALNFRDVLNALGMYPGDPGPLGVECVGEIVAIGPDVHDWNVGDQVLAMPYRGYCTYTNSRQTMLFKRPPNMSLVDAATLLTAYLTAAYSLNHLGKMKAGDRVLIHAAAGGVGLAAVQLAQQAGAEIFATAGSPAKREYLRKLGVQHVMDSRSVDFATQIRTLTAGQGIDLVLNSLTGQALSESLSLLRPGGCFLEIGKTELFSDEQVARINPGARYHVIDLVPPFRDTPELMQQLFSDIAQSLAAGRIRPLPHRTFNLPDAPQAFRYMAAARHLGKVVVVDRSATVTRLFEPTGTYLITGGLGGLGLAVAQWMAAQGARRLVLVGRSAPNAVTEQIVAELRSNGAQVVVASADVGDRRQVAELLKTHTSPAEPLRGVIHAAGVIDDGALLLQDWPRFDRVLKPKLDGAWHLHELTLQTPLDFFVMFSSGAGLIGNPGQSSYAAANVFLDELASARQAAGLPALSIHWGPWANVGMAAAMNGQHVEDWNMHGLSTIDPAQGITALQMLMSQSQISQMAVLPIDLGVWRRQFAGQAVPPLIKNLITDDGKSSATASSDTLQAAERLRQADPNDKRNVMIEIVGEMVLSIAGFDRLRSIPPDQNLATLGMDSLLAIQLSNRLKTNFAAAVPPTLAFQYPTVEAIADYLLNILSASDEAPHEAVDAQDQANAMQAAVQLGGELDPRQAQSILANLDQLSDRDVETLLSAMEIKPDSA